MWQLFQDAILTREVMKKRGWKGNPKCSFCGENETSQHLFFTCPIARVTWRSVACMLGTDLCPNSLWQAYSWCYVYFSDGEVFYTVGIAALCWAIWTCRNGATFESKHLKTPFECCFSMCAFLCYWAGLLKEEDRVKLQAGVKRLAHAATALADRSFPRRRLLLGDRDGVQIG